MTHSVGIAGLGTIGLAVARALDAGMDGLRLDAVAVRDPVRAQAALASFAHRPEIVPLGALAAADIVLEAAPAALFAEIAGPAIAAGRILVVCSGGALLPRMELVDAARRSGARIIVPTGALLGLDAVRAAAEGELTRVTIETRKPPGGLAGAPYLLARGIDPTATAVPLLVFAGTAREAAAGFPANVNVAAALALAGIGPDRTMVEIWADPALSRNTHTVRVEAAAARFSMTIENVPSEANPRTGMLTALSVIACLRGLTSPLRIGS
jgi:aspartate dehydrogenase